MRQVNCVACKTTVPMNEAFSAAEQSLCGPCLEKFLEGRAEGTKSADDISRQLDPTICIHCAADNGDADWSTVAGLPTCAKCEHFLRNRPFPGWLKASFVVFLCVAIAAFIYNWRFFMAYVELLKGNGAMADGNIPQAVAYFESAARRVPDILELSVIPNLYRAQQLLAEDKNEEALALLNKARAHASPEWADTIRGVTLMAENGIAFDRKDYDTFLSQSEELATLMPNEPGARASVASAYACKYVVTGDPAFRDQANEQLERAKTMAGPDNKGFEVYENRIRHRLATGEIISRQQFEERFPNGWKPEGAE